MNSGYPFGNPPERTVNKDVRLTVHLKKSSRAGPMVSCDIRNSSYPNPSAYPRLNCFHCSNIAALLHTHHHQSDVVPLCLTGRERCNFIQDAGNDLLRCFTAARPQQILEPLFSP